MRKIITTFAFALGLAASAQAQTYGGGGTQGGWPIIPPPILIPPTFPGSIDLSTNATAGGGTWSFTLPRDPLGTVSGSAAASFVPPALPDTSGSSWLGLPFTGEAYELGGTSVTYSIDFSLAGSVPGTARLSGLWSAFGDTDSPVVLSLNGTEIGSLGDVRAFPTALTAFSVDPALFLADSNTLSISFQSIPGSTLQGLELDSDIIRLQAAVTATPVPAPGGAVAIIGLLGLGLLRRRRGGRGN
jgi:MYXO-CTERM domain-containing protein